jgi:hypothetical protein
MTNFFSRNDLLPACTLTEMYFHCPASHLLLLGLITHLAARASPTLQGKVIVHTFMMELIVTIWKPAP